MKLEKDQLNRLYWKLELSMPSIAKELGVPKSNVEYWMKKFGIPRRPLLRYPRAKFSGDSKEKAYMLGLRYGDLYAARYKKGIVISTTTTHPAMAELFWSTFRGYGRIYMHPFFNRVNNGHQWVLRVVVHDSFSFILDKPSKPPNWALSKDNFLHFVAGFFDAEGSIVITTRIRHGRWRVIETSLTISNTRKSLLRMIGARLRDYHPVLELNRRKGPDTSAYGGMRRRSQWTLIVRRRIAVEHLLEEWKIRHPEKIMKSNIALAALRGCSYASVKSSVKALRLRIAREVEAFAALAVVLSKIDQEIASIES